MQTLYTAVGTATNGREGRIHIEESGVDLPLSIPKALGGPGGTGVNPEQLFAAGYAACFGSALKLVAGAKKLAVSQAAITAHVSLGKTDAGGYALAVELHGSFPGLSQEDAHALLEAAHQVCPYSVATRGNIEVKLVVDPT